MRSELDLRRQLHVSVHRNVVANISRIVDAIVDVHLRTRVAEIGTVLVVKPLKFFFLSSTGKRVRLGLGGMQIHCILHYLLDATKDLERNSCLQTFRPAKLQIFQEQPKNCHSPPQAEELVTSAVFAGVPELGSLSCGAQVFNSKCPL